MNDTTTTPLFDTPLHTLLCALGFAEGEGHFALDDPDTPRQVTIEAPTGYGFVIPLPDTGLGWQLDAIFYALDGFDPEIEDTARQARREGYGRREWHDILIATDIWCDMQVVRMLKDTDGLLQLMRLDPRTMPRDRFLDSLCVDVASMSGTVLFTLLDVYLKHTEQSA